MSENAEKRVEYRVKPVMRYVITRHEETENTGSTATKGEYDNADVAWEVAYALCRAEHERLGYPPADERIQYPRRPITGGVEIGNCPAA